MKPSRRPLQGPRALQTARFAIVLMALLFATPSAARPYRPRPPRASPHQLARPLHPPRVAPLITRRILILTLSRTSKGLRVVTVQHARLKKKRPLRRFRGPFEVRLYTGALLRDTVTFNFPLTLRAGERNRANTRLDGALLAGVVEARATVRIPWEPTLTHLILIDHPRHTRTRYPLKKPQDNRRRSNRIVPSHPKDTLRTGPLFAAPKKLKGSPSAPKTTKRQGRAKRQGKAKTKTKTKRP
ncbi:MAG: hypothetical protein KAI47_14360 [Deltaproteobacteria bacterium]|nr:hypothetical protein [Deltaproteobacteria bacterium]